ncbi:MAG TPA: OmpA family protein [Phycisphaerae bacterium]|nr:OmpA family protein [Phycisphaerae bacterium]
MNGSIIPGAWRMMALAGVVAGLSAITGCVSEDQYQKLQTAYDQARAQLADADDQLAAMRTQIAQLQADLAEDEKELTAQGGGNSALADEIAALKARLAQLQDQYNQLLALAGNAPQLPQAVNDALNRLAEEYPNLLSYDPKLGMLRFKSDLLFALGSTDLTPEAQSALKEFAGIINDPAIVNNEIRIVGNTDDVPIRYSRYSLNPANINLSANRAISVWNFLKDQGVLDRRMQVAGWGETHPIAPNAPGHHGNPLNRRVDIYILPTQLEPNPYVPGGDQGTAPENSGSMTPTTNPPDMTGGGNDNSNGGSVPLPSGSGQ